MARPQTEKGFVMVALDLFAALMAADIPNRGAIVLAEVLLQTYGPGKLSRGVKAVHLDPAQIEHYTGLHRNNARKAVRELVAANILEEQKDGSFKFNKDYESWKPGGESMADRLGGGLLRFASSAQSRYGHRNKSASDPIQGDFVSTDTPIQGDSTPKDFPNPTGLRSEGSCESLGIGPDVDMTGGKGGSGTACAPASEDQKNGDKREDASASSRTRADSIEPFEPTPAELPPEITGPGPDSPEGKALIEWARTLGNDPQGGNYAEWVAGVLHHAPAHWIRDLLNRKVATGSRRANIRLIGSILAQWRHDRQPEWPIPDPAQTRASLNGTAPKGLTAEQEDAINARHAKLRLSARRGGTSR